MKHRLASQVHRILVFVALVCGVEATHAQETNLLLHYTNIWRYLDTGADPGADWAQPAFDDSAWPAGPGPFGLDERPPYPYPLAVKTPLTVGSPATPAHFLRTHFTVTNFPPGMALVAQCYVDDAMVLFLNGVEVARLFVPSNQTFQTYSQEASFVEGTNYQFLLPTNLVTAGENVLAVEIHQNLSISSDAFWGLKLLAIAPRPLVITQQPVSVVTNVGAPASFEVVIDGGPAACKWLRSGVTYAPAGTSQSFTFNSVSANLAGNYQVVVTNLLGAVTSAVATLTVVADTFPPVLVEAPVQLYGSTGISNAIMLTFSERLKNTTTSATNNYSVADPDSGAAVEVFQADLNNNVVRLKVGGPNWVIGRRYKATVNGVQDMAGNLVANNSQIEVAWSESLIPANAVWHFHSAYLADPAIVDANWTLPDYQENEHWLQAPAPFGQFLTGAQCFGGIHTTLHNQAHPSLFRIPFLWPADAGARATVQISNMVERGLCLFLNGREYYRDSLSQPAGTPISADSHTYDGLSPALPVCSSSSVTLSNLVAGTNWLAVAIFPPYYANSPYDQTNSIVFALSATANYKPAAQVTEPSRPQLSAHRQPPDSVIFNWAGTNCVLQRTTSLSTNAIWSDVTPPTNGPLILPADAAAGFFRLKQP